MNKKRVSEVGIIIRFLGAGCGMVGFFLLGLGGSNNVIIGTGLTGIGGILLAAAGNLWNGYIINCHNISFNSFMF